MKFDIKSLLFESEPSPTPVVPVTPTVPVATLPAPDPINANIDDRIKDALAAAIVKAKLDGFNYFEFKELLKSLATSITDERTRYQSAYAMATTMKVDATKLIETANYYIKVLNDEATNFKTTMEQTYTSEVTNKESALKQFDVDIQAKSDQINRLTTEINEIQDSKRKLSEEIIDRKGKIEKTNSNFTLTFNDFVSKINTDIDRIKLYLQGATNGK